MPKEAELGAIRRAYAKQTLFAAGVGSPALDDSRRGNAGGATSGGGSV